MKNILLANILLEASTAILASDERAASYEAEIKSLRAEIARLNGADSRPRFKGDALAYFKMHKDFITSRLGRKSVRQIARELYAAIPACSRYGAAAPTRLYDITSRQWFDGVMGNLSDSDEQSLKLYQALSKVLRENPTAF